MMTEATLRSATLRLPPLHDHHSHVSLYAALEGRPDLMGKNEEAARELLVSLPRDRLSLVKGWRTDALPFERSDFESLPPVLVVNASLHGFAASPAALPFLAASWPELAQRADDEAWGELHLPELFGYYGRTAGLDEAKLRDFMRGLERIGIASIEDMTLSGEAAYRIVSSSGYGGRVGLWAAPEVFAGLSSEARSACSGIKIFLDGSLGARSAAIEPPFLDGAPGRLLRSQGRLRALLDELSRFGTGLSIHAIGRRAIAQALDGLERLGARRASFSRIRLEHVQFIDEEQARSAKRRGYVLSMQPNFSSDSVDYADRLAPALLAANNPFRMLIDRARFVPGEDLVFGSDGMPHGPESAFQWGLFPSHPGQILSIDELIAGYRSGGERRIDDGLPSAVLHIDSTGRRVRLSAEAEPFEA